MGTAAALLTPAIGLGLNSASACRYQSQRIVEFDDFRKQRPVVEHRIARLGQPWPPAEPGAASSDGRSSGPVGGLAVANPPWCLEAPARASQLGTLVYLVRALRRVPERVPRLSRVLDCLSRFSHLFLGLGQKRLSASPKRPPFGRASSRWCYPAAPLHSDHGFTLLLLRWSWCSTHAVIYPYMRISAFRGEDRLGLPWQSLQVVQARWGNRSEP